MSQPDRDTPLLDDLGLSLAAEQEVQTGADLPSVRARLMTAALEESDAIADTNGDGEEAEEAPELSVAPVVALADGEAYDPGPSVWWTSARTSLMAMGALFFVLLIGGTAFTLTKLRVGGQPLIGSKMKVGPAGWAFAVEREARPGIPGVIRVRGATELRAPFPVKRVSGEIFEVWVPVALGTTDESVSVTMTLTDSVGAERSQTVEVPVVPGREPRVTRLSVNPDKLMASKVVRQQERQMLEALMGEAQPFEQARPLADAFVWPIEGAEHDTSSDFGELRVFSREGPQGEDIVTVFDRHLGVDVRGHRGEPVLATERGRVLMSMQLEHGGVTVVLQHRQGVFTLYQHLAASEVGEGEVVDRGQRLGTNGTSGAASGPHVHYAVWAKGAWLDPAELPD